MTTDYARRWLVLASLVVVGAEAVFLVIAPVLDYPLEYPKNLNLLQIVTPVLLGYLGSAANFVFMTPAPQIQANTQLLGLLVKGPVIIYVVVITAAFVAFGYSNRSGAPIGSGMSVDSLNMAVSISLGILSATTSVIVARLFVSNETARNEPVAAQTRQG